MPALQWQMSHPEPPHMESHALPEGSVPPHLCQKEMDPRLLNARPAFLPAPYAVTAGSSPPVASYDCRNAFPHQFFLLYPASSAKCCHPPTGHTPRLLPVPIRVLLLPSAVPHLTGRLLPARLSPDSSIFPPVSDIILSVCGPA